MAKHKPNTRHLASALLAVLLVLLLLLALTGFDQQKSNIPCDPICRITYYLAEDGSICTMLENLSEYDLTITFPDGIQPPAAEIGGNDGRDF